MIYGVVVILRVDKHLLLSTVLAYLVAYLQIQSKHLVK
jgi:hypothetical protein